MHGVLNKNGSPANFGTVVVVVVVVTDTIKEEDAEGGETCAMPLVGNVIRHN